MAAGREPISAFTLSLIPVTTFSLDAPAKINLWLRVLGRREDGFHALETRLAPLALCDRLTLQADAGRAVGDIGFDCDDPSVPGDESNLVVRAVRELEKATGKLPGMRFFLEKRIPHGAGLGGGSSDAAAALRLVRAAFCPEVEEAILYTAAGAVGSDVPFFLLGKVADASGRGEIVEPVPDAGICGSPRVLLVKLPFGISTPWAYKNWRDSVEVPGLLYAPQQTPWGELRNDLERPVFEKYPVLGLLKARLREASGVTAVLLSGSGSTVFALLEEDADVLPVVEAVKEEAGEEFQYFDTRMAPGGLPVSARTVPA